MCLLLFYYKQFPLYPLVLCANRDEYYERPAEPPFLWDAEEGEIRFVAPRDLRAGGTWIGLNAAHGVAAITNRAAVPQKKNALSRGGLLRRILPQGSAEAMVRAGLETWGQGIYNGFNLLLADPRSAFLLMGHERGVECRSLSPGIHLLTNEHDLNEVEISSPEKLFQDEAMTSEDLLIGRLMDILKSHDPLDAHGFSPCKHKGNRGTRSAALLLMGKEKVRFLFADGPPCSTPYQDLHDLMRSLAQ